MTLPTPANDNPPPARDIIWPDADLSDDVAGLFAAITTDAADRFVAAIGEAEALGMLAKENGNG